MLKTSTFGLNTSSQVCSPLVNCTINQRLLHAALHVCWMCVVCHFLQEDQVNQFRAPFLTNFLFLFVSISYLKIPESVAERRSLLIHISLKSKLCLLQYQFEIFTSYLLKFTPQLRRVYVMNKKVNSLFRGSIHSCFQTCKSY